MRPGAGEPRGPTRHVVLHGTADPLPRRRVAKAEGDFTIVERESRDVVEHLREKGKTVDFLVFENEGHDVLKFENRVTCYNKITDFFKQYLKP